MCESKTLPRHYLVKISRVHGIVSDEKNDTREPLFLYEKVAERIKNILIAHS